MVADSDRFRKPSPQDAAREFLQLMEQNLDISMPVSNTSSNQLPAFRLDKNNTYGDAVRRYFLYEEMCCLLDQIARGKPSPQPVSEGSLLPLEPAMAEEYRDHLERQIDLNPENPVELDPRRLSVLERIIYELQPACALPHLLNIMPDIAAGKPVDIARKQLLREAEENMDNIVKVYENALIMHINPKFRRFIDNITKKANDNAPDDEAINHSHALSIIECRNRLAVMDPIHNALHQVNRALNNLPPSQEHGV